MTDLDQFKATYHDMIERLDKALDIAARLLGKRWGWNGDCDIDGDTIEATLSAYYRGEEDTEQVSFPLEWLWSGGPDGDLAVTFSKGREYQRVLNANKALETQARRDKEIEKRDRREFERLQLKFAGDAAEEKDEGNEQ